MNTRIAGAIIGIVFGVVLSWSGMTSPEIIREGLLFQSPYLFLFFAGAMLTATVGLRCTGTSATPAATAPSRPSRAAGVYRPGRGSR